MLKKYYWIIAGCFLGGILLCGLGVGICFAEFSGFSYAGDRELGQVVDKTLSYRLDEEAERYYVDVRSFGGYYGYYGYEDVALVTDPSLAANEIQVEVSYNNDLDELWLYGRAYPEEIVIKEEEAELTEDTETDQEETPEEEEMTGEMAGEVSAAEISDEVPKQKEEVREVMVQDIGIHWDYDDLKIMMKYKDVILEDLKQGQIGSYGRNPYFKITGVRCNPNIEDKIQLVY
ncbi:MAG: hypothetical protein J1E61_05005 [Lachnospiraceae bacterium]|nr:hypothetical protein [Lachnospiraceae bacterium]